MSKPRMLFAALLMLLILLVAACSGPPETQVYIVLTPTYGPATLTALAESGQPVVVDASAEAAVATPAPDTTAATSAVSAFPTAMPTANPLPTALVSQIQVAEQAFEHGRMFWLFPTQKIWVMIDAPDSVDHGQWLIFDDTWQEGDVENDPELTPPPNLLQPVRGFGKLWRENQEVQDALGWAVTPEYGFVSNYEYRPGGYLDSTGAYVAGPGVHVLYSLGNQAFAFEERDNTWRVIE